MDGAVPATPTSRARFSVSTAGLAPASPAEAALVERLRAVEDDDTLVVQARETPVPGVSADEPAALLRAAAIADAVGPITTVGGGLVWFDLLPLVRLVPVYFAGDAAPALLFSVPNRIFRVGEVLPSPEILGLLTQQYRLGAGSIWLRADLLADDAPAGSYVGLRIASGVVSFQPRPVDAGGRLTIPAGGQCGVELLLDAPAPPPAGAGQAGADAADASLVTPPTVAFRLGGGHATVAGLADAHWEVFGQPADFHWAGAAPAYEPTMRGLVVPMEVTIDAVAPAAVRSPAVTLTGSGPVVESGWLLPALAIDVTAPPEAAGDGGLGIRAGTGLMIGWPGLRRGPVTLTGPWIVLVPGILGVIETAADNRYATQRLELWEDGRTPFRSRVDVRYSTVFPVRFSSAATGTELLLTTAAFDASLDRPVDVRGTPLALHGRRGRLMLTITDAAVKVRLLATGLLADALALAGTFPVEPGGTMSLAIRNALFTTTPADGFLLTGTLTGGERVGPGSTTITLGLYGLLPTLPDPYAANAGWLLAGRQVRGQGAAVIALLQATVDWTPPAAAAGADTVTTSFAFAPVGAFGDDFVLWARARSDVAAHRRAVPVTSLDAEASNEPAPQGAAAYRYWRDQSDEVWDRTSAPSTRSSSPCSTCRPTPTRWASASRGSIPPASPTLRRSPGASSGPDRASIPRASRSRSTISTSRPRAASCAPSPCPRSAGSRS